MNIPVNGPNDLNDGPRRPSWIQFVFDCFGERCLDFLIRFSVPLISCAVLASYKIKEAESNREMERRRMKLEEDEAQVAQLKTDLLKQRKGFDGSALVDVIKQLEFDEKIKTNAALREIEDLQPLIKKYLSIRCSPLTPREQRKPIEKEIRRLLVRSGSPLTPYGRLREQMTDNIDTILERDVKHCDYVIMGRGDNGLIYKIYRENWRLTVENKKLGNIIEKLKLQGINTSRPKTSQSSHS